MHVVPWDIRITIDLFLGGLGIGLFLFSILFYGKGQNNQLAKIAAYLSPILVGLGLVFLISELGRPERFFTTLYNFNPQSLTSWGGLFQGGFMILAFVYAVMYYKNNISGKLFTYVQVFGAISALLVGSYHGLLLSSLGRGLWAGGFIPVLFLISSLLGGLSILVILKSANFSFPVAKEGKAEVAATSTTESDGPNYYLLTAILTGISFILLMFWQVSMYRSNDEAVATTNQMMGDYGLLWWGLVIAAGLLIPFIASVYQLMKGTKVENSSMLAIILAVLILIGSFVFKYIILTAGQINIPFFL